MYKVGSFDRDAINRVCTLPVINSTRILRNSFLNVSKCCSAKIWVGAIRQAD